MFENRAPLFRSSSSDVIVQLLKDPAWKEPIGDVAQYLRLTHFLSQSVEQRFAAREPNDRWSALEAPAGTERLNRARELLGTGGLTRAFNEREKAAEEVVADATLDLERWRQVLQRRDSLRQILQSGGGSNPTEILPALAALLREVSTISLNQLTVTPVSEANQDAVLKDIGDVIRSVTRELAELRTRADTAKELPREWIDCLNATSRIKAARSENRRRQAELSNVLAVRREEVSKALGHRSEAANGQRAANERLSRTQSALNARQELDRIKDALVQQMTSEKAAGQSFSEAARTLELANATAVTRRKLEQDWMSAASRRRVLVDTQTAVTSLKSIWTELHGLAGLKQQTLAKIATARAARDAEMARADKLSKELAELEASAELQRLKVGAIQSAVSVIAAHLSTADCSCPVCSTSFAPGELRRLAAESSAASNSILASVESAIKVSSDTLQMTKAHARQLGTDLENEERSLRKLAEAETQWASKRLGVQSLPLLKDLQESEYDATLDELLAALEMETKDIDARRTAAGSVSGADSAAMKAEIDFQAAKSGLDDMKRCVDASRSRIAQLEALLQSGSTAATLPTIDELQTALRVAVGDVSLADERFANSDILYNAAVREEVALNEQLGQAAEAVAASEREMVALNALTEALLTRWRGIGLKGEPSASGLADLLASVDQRDIQLTRASATHRELLGKLELWRKAVEFREVSAQIDSALKPGDTTEAAHTQHLNALIAAGMENLAAVRAAAEHKTRIVESLQKESTRYTSEVLRPINQLNAAFLRMFSCFSDFTVSLDARANKANVQLDLVVKWLTTQKARSAQASVRDYLSEGQLSALSVGLLLSMSAMYRWSCWRALLLDDPLQHNDVIHAAAFIEVLRGLVRFEGYQVILSTHDLALADYIRRKLLASKIECRTCQFLGIGTNGVLHENS